MKNRTYMHCRNGAVGVGWIKTNQRKVPAAWSCEFLASRTTGPIEAIGGPCPIIVLFDSQSGAGALVHIDGGNAENGGDEHTVLLDKLLENVPEISTGAVVHIFYDSTPWWSSDSAAEKKEQKAQRDSYIEEVKDSLEAKGFESIRVVKKKLGKNVYLNTGDRSLLVLADDDSVITNLHYD